MTDKEKLEKCLGSKQFFTPYDLLKLGVFGSKTAIYRCMSNGELPFVHITPMRKVIMRNDLVEFMLRMM